MKIPLKEKRTDRYLCPNKTRLLNLFVSHQLLYSIKNLLALLHIKLHNRRGLENTPTAYV